MKDFEKTGCQVLGISVDSQFSHKSWVESDKKVGGLGGKLGYPLLSDLKKTVGRDYGVLLPGGIALRSSFLINPEGTIMHQTTNFLPVGRSANEALRVVKAFQFVSANEGKVCPLDWNEGSDPMEANVEGMRKYLTSH